MSLGRSAGRPEAVSRNAPHPLPWRFSRVGADRVPVGRSQGFDASRPTPVRGCGCRSRPARLSVPERLPGRHGPARTLPSRSAGHGRERGAVVRVVRRGVSGADFTRAKPSWPSPACEPPVRSEPAPAGRLLCAGCRRRRWGTQVETPPPPGPSAWAGGSSRGRGDVTRNHSQHGERAGGGYERIGERVSIFVKGRVWYANHQECPKQKRTTLRTRNHEVARQKAL